MQQPSGAFANETLSILESARVLSQMVVTKQFTDDNLRRLGGRAAKDSGIELCGLLFMNDYNLIALRGLVEQFVREFDRNADAAVRRAAPAHVAAMKRLDAPRGFEPRLTESESVVLPLDDGAMPAGGRDRKRPSHCQRCLDH